MSILKRLQVPNHRVDVVLDTDAFNEIDDQFAIVYMIRSSDKLDVKGIYAAPFANKPGKALSPQEGMKKSYLEILKVLELVNYPT